MDPIQIINNTGTVSIQHDDFIISVVLVIATFAGVAVAIVASWLSNKRTKESNELLKTELESRLRPWLSLTDPFPFHVILKDGRSVSYDEITEDPKIKIEDYAEVSFAYYVSNPGQLPAKRVMTATLKQSTPINRETFGTVNISEHDGFIIMPGQKHRTLITLTGQEFMDLDTKPIHIGISCIYEINQYLNGQIWSTTEILKTNMETNNGYIELKK